VNCLASHLREDGLQKGDRVAFLCPNTPALLEAHFAVPAAGGILVAVNTCLNSQEIDYILNLSGVKFLFVDAELVPLVEPLHLEGIQVVRIDDTGSA
jgi:fatty-acyl-CoA synthase